MRDLTGKHDSFKCHFGVLRVMQSHNPMKNLKLTVKILRVGTTNIYLETKVWNNKKVLNSR